MISLYLIFLPLLIEYVYRHTDDWFIDYINSRLIKYKKIVYMVCKVSLTLGGVLAILAALI